jgi:hypothetical protein
MAGDQGDQYRLLYYLPGPQNHSDGGWVMSLERIISVGLLGWLVVGFLLMGLNVW